MVGFSISGVEVIFVRVTSDIDFRGHERTAVEAYITHSLVQ
jgi:hypothetical protein